jgi:pilus assembly protein CpaB
MRIIILVVAGGAALLAAMLVRGMGGQKEPDVVQVAEQISEPEIPLTQILIAASDMPMGHRISPDDLSWQEWPEAHVNETYFQAEVSPDAITELSGAVVRTGLFSGEPILAQKIVRTGDAGFMAAVLKEGMRAVAVEISVETAAGGFILPNDRVDVVLSYSVDVNEGDMVVDRPATKTVLQNVRVLAIDQTFTEYGEESVVVGTTATLELKPAHAEVLMLATRMGDLSLTLRGIADAQENGSEVIANSAAQSVRGANDNIRIYKSGTVEQTNVGGTK